MTSQSDYIAVKQAFRVVDSYNSFNGYTYATQVQLINTSNIITAYMSTFINPNKLTSTTIGLGTLGYISTGASLNINELQSTITGLGTTGYISSLSIQSTITGLGTTGYVSSLSLQSTVAGLGAAGYISSLSLQSTVDGLGTTGYVSSLSLQSTVAGLGTTGYVSSLSLQSTVAGLGTTGYLSSLSLQSTVAGLGTTGYLSSFNVIPSTVVGLGTVGYISSLSLQSTVAGLGAAGYISSLSLQSTVAGLGITGYISSLSLQSTVVGLGTTGYLSSFNVIPSTVAGLGATGYISSLSLQSTVAGLGTAGYLSSFNVIPSTVAGLGTTGYLSSFNVITSTVAGLGTSDYISSLSLQSTVTGLGTAGYISSFNIIPSTVTGLGTAGYLSSFNVITSTVAGLGTAGYISSFNIIPSTVTGLGTVGYISSLSLTSSLKGLGTFGYLSTAGFAGPGVSSLSTSVAYGVSTLSTTIGLQISSILSSLTTFPRLGNTLTVDQINGDDTTAAPSGLPYKTVNAAVSAVLTGDTIWVLPGTYNLTSPIVLPNNISIRGMSLQKTTIQMLNVTSNTTLIKMGENTRVEDLTLKLTSQGHYTLTGIEFGGTTSVTGKIRTCVLTIDNSNALTNGTSDINAILASGTGTLGTASFSFNSLKGSTFNVYSNGAGKKRGVLVSGPNVISTRDINVYVANPRDNSSTGSYIGIETNDINNLGSIQLRTATIGTVSTILGGSYTYSDILQTTPATIIDPTYLASAGIQVGPGTDLVTKTAGGHGASVYNYPTTIYYGLRGNIKDGTNENTIGYMWPGTQSFSGGGAGFPDVGTPPAYYRVQQPCIILGMAVGLSGGTTGGNTVTVTLYYTPKNGTIKTSPFTVTFAAGEINKTFYNASLTLGTGDNIHVGLSYTGANNAAHDLTVQIDTF